ncbi:DUF1269 domain-containing protein [Candidatus Enterococcus mansonii]|uniref:DUF1269 domain-containing protein n=1 Tax=Candidatus Enterococcus mansonii TaxID=1834181 RepID=A0A242CJU7_9ENTE|nr:DUF1269 domain-containing protein [Enterococcus sp. 4G2_DIV0659]OTO10429.1 hypothetical protein A5880_001113 [Enterococcus sp. 4G2_DIV0659]
MSKRVIIMHFEVESQAYQAFSEIKKLYVEKKVKGEQMAVVTHVNDGIHQFKIDDFIDFTGNNHTSTNSMIGMLIGILGGPLGILLGWFAGSLLGASQDAKEIQGAQTVFEHVTKQIGEGETGLLLIAEEEDNRPLNQLVMNELGGEIIRLDFEDVEQEISNAKQVEQETKDTAEKSWQNKNQ